MFIVLETGAGPLYLQLYQQIKDRITDGTLSGLSWLPSSRRLAQDLSISRNTVELAYQQLCAEGYLGSRSRRGYYVEELEPGLAVAAEPVSAPPSAAIVPTCLPRYDFRYGMLDPAAFPFDLWRKLTAQCLRKEQQALLSYGDQQGEPGLRAAIARYLYEHRGVNCQPKQIVIVAGTQHGLTIVCQLLKSSSGVAAIEEPGYAGARAVFINQGFSLQPVKLDEDSLSIEQLAASDADVVYVTPSHQFPTGTVMPVAKRRRLLAWAQSRHRFIIEDDYSCHLRYGLKPIPALQGLGDGSAVIYVGSFAKSLSPSLRIAYLVLPPALLDTYRSVYRDYDPAIPILSQKTLELFMSLGYWERHLRKTTRLNKQKHDLLIRSLNQHLRDRVTLYGQTAGLHLMLEVAGSLTERELIERAAAAGVGVYPVSRHWLQVADYTDNMVLLGFGGIRGQDIDPGIKLLSRAWRD